VSRLMSLVWIAQFWVFIALTVMSVVRPSGMMFLLDQCVPAPHAPLCCPAVGDGGEAQVEPGADVSLVHGLGRERAVACPGVDPPPGKPAEPALGCGPQPCVGCLEGLPEYTPCVLVESDLETQGLYALVRMLAPFYLAFALFSLHAMMRTDERTRRNLSFIFAGVFTVLAVMVYTDGLGDLLFQDAARAVAFQGRALFAGLVSLLLFSVHSLVRAEDGSRRAAAGLSGLAYGALLVPFALGKGAVIDATALGSVTIGDSSHSTIHALAAAAGLVLAVDTLAGDLERTRARLFAVVLVFPVVLFALDLAGQDTGSNALADEPWVVRLVLLLTLVDIFLHAQYAAWPIEDAEQTLSGSANTRPPSLWVLWLFQGLAFWAFAALLVWAHSGSDAEPSQSLFVSRAIMDRLALTDWYAGLYGDLDEIYPAFLIAMGLFSFSGMHSSREWVWKVHCFIFAAFYGAQVVCVMFAWDPVTFKPALLLLLVPSSVLCLVHVFFYMSRRSWFSEDVGQGPDGWILPDLVLGPLLFVKSTVTRRRTSHTSGVAATGRMIVAGSPGIPPHELFRPGALMDVIVRFSNERSADDASADARGAALALVAEDGARFDLTLSTGAFGSARNIVEYGLIQIVTGLGRPGRALLARVRRFLEGGLAALRRAPSSYAALWYFSQSVRFWISSDRNERWLVRYRLTPEDPAAEESGLGITIADYVGRDRARGERRPTDYLRRELKMRLQGPRTLKLRLQAQFHNVSTGDGLAWYDPTSDWHAGVYPWIDLGEITLQLVLSDEACERLTFNTDNAPSSLGIPVSQGVTDPRSIADSERRVMRRVQALRLWLVAVLGLPRTPLRPVK
jgi:hypothetical protein